jgi:hypothetical protein
MRVIFAVAFMFLSLLGPALAQSEEAPWQASVTGQIQALRAADAEAALAFAGEGFRTRFKERPEEFFATIVTAGYAPIALSRSHSFGQYERISEVAVLQVVNFVGHNQALYEAIYELVDEPGEGWRVLGVVLRKIDGVGI